MHKGRNITVSAPAKLHLLGEHAAVYGKPAILTALDLRVKVTVSQGRTIPQQYKKIQQIIDRIVKKELKLKKFPLYSLEISSNIPAGIGLGFSAALSAAYVGALLDYLRVDWNLELINRLAFEAEKVFHGNPSGGDNSTVVYGGLVWFRKEDTDLKLIQPIPFPIPAKLGKNFILINTGKPQESTKEMVDAVKLFSNKKPKLLSRFLENQEKLVKNLLTAIKEGQEKELVKIIKEGEKNLEEIGVVSQQTREIIRKIEKSGGAAKISGAGGKKDASGILLCYHKNKIVLQKLAEKYGLAYFLVKLGSEGVRIEK